MGAVMGAKPKEPMSDEDSDIAMNDRESFPYHLRPLFESAPGIPGQDELVHFNVSGRTFTTLSTTLNNFPESIFGTKEKRSHLKRTKDGAIFLNRNPSVFKKVLTFYQTGIFEFPEKMNQNIFVQDVSYYGLAKQAISCQIQGFTQEVVEVPTRRWQAKLWRLLEDPDSSTGARVMSFWSIMVILTSIIVFCWETLPGYRENHGRHESRTGDILDQIELACIIWFTLEFVARFALSPNKCTFIKSWLNIIDFVAILPFFITFAGKFEGQVSIYFLRCVRLVRVFRVFKLSRHSVEMKILAIAVKSSARELGVLVFFILLGVLLFSSAVYYAEIGNSETKLKSIPAAFWWAIVSMTTVGYGDVVPITIVGRLVGAFAAMSGILVIALPIPIIVNNFTRQYQRLKPVSKYWGMVREREKKSEKYNNIHGLYSPHKKATTIAIEPDSDVTYCTDSNGNIKTATDRMDDKFQYYATEWAPLQSAETMEFHHQNHVFPTVAETDTLLPTVKTADFSPAAPVDTPNSECAISIETNI